MHTIVDCLLYFGSLQRPWVDLRAPSLAMAFNVFGRICLKHGGSSATWTKLDAVVDKAIVAVAVWDVFPFVDEKRPVSDPTVGQLCWVYGSVYCMHTLPKPDRVLYRLVGVTREALLLTSAF